MMKLIVKLGALLILLLGLSSCDVVEEFLGTSSCSSYNAPEDEFRIDIIQREVVVDVGDSQAIDVERTWLNLDLDRVALDCSPTWNYQPAGVVEIEEFTLTALTPGVAKVTAEVSGEAGDKRDHFWVAVRPLATESEPNNGVAGAQTITGSIVGYIDYDDDVDWFVAEVAAGQSYQFTLGSALESVAGDPFSEPSYGGALFDKNGDEIGEVNRSYANTSGATMQIFVKVSGYQETLPYRLEFDAF